ncbi:hypothetical protein JTE90_024369 [Oedothorax gibbosus]|uniref:Uncharacterized protein n=1 Tax=Oedothorax gibbosus TaxID=931172 RepID=A0AAV6TE68_9ARAC|nr:hypothetical protein JTE90_024369 [Oedothorax gibbosus]
MSMVGYAPTRVVTGDGERGFDSGEGAEKRLPHQRGRQQAANYPPPGNGEVVEKNVGDSFEPPKFGMVHSKSFGFTIGGKSQGQQPG